MSLSHGLLGLLTYGNNTGYELSKLFAYSLNFFWNAQRSQIYRELNRMESAGLVSSQSIVQEGRPNKRLYSITPAGREEFTNWLTNFQYKPENSHNSLIMRIFFGAEIDPARTVELLKEFQQRCAEELASLQTVATQNVNIYSQAVAEGDFKKVYWKVTVDGGIYQLRALIEWAELSVKTLEGMV